MKRDGLPAVVPDPAMTEHLEILGVLARGRIGRCERVGQTHTRDRLLADTAELFGGIDADGFEHRRNEIGHMMELVTDAPLCLRLRWASG